MASLSLHACITCNAEWFRLREHSAEVMGWALSFFVACSMRSIALNPKLMYAGVRLIKVPHPGCLW